MNRHLFTALLSMGLTLPCLAVTPQDASAPEAITFTESGDGLQANLRVASETLEVGMPLELTITVTGANAKSAMFPVIEDTLGSFEVISSTLLRSDPGSPEIRGLRILLNSYVAGSMDIPALEITNGAGGDPLLLGPVTIEVSSLIGADAGPDAFRDIRDAVAIPTEKASLTTWLIAGGAVILVGTLLVWWLATRPRRPVPIEPEDIRALRQLDELEREDLPNRGQVQNFFFDLTDITRTFIERRYEIKAPERTTQEFMVEAQRHHELDPEHGTLLARLLKSADMVKFAGDRPAQDECHRSMEFVRRFVQESGRRPILDESEHETGTPVAPPVAERLTSMGLDESPASDTFAGRTER